MRFIITLTLSLSVVFLAWKIGPAFGMKGFKHFLLSAVFTLYVYPSMKKSKSVHYLRRLYLRITSSIAFYPGLMALGLFVLAVGCLSVDAVSYGGAIAEAVSFLAVREAETARTLLGSLAGGLISLMVFSFSMVMIVLNQTASNYSPRVLPGLVSRPEHQVVLGVYLGTIAFTLAVLSNVGSESFELLVPRFSIIVNLLLALGCLFAFVYFIHDISNTIQIGNIIMRLYGKTRVSLIRELKSEHYLKEPLPRQEQKHVVKAWQSGYFFTVAEKSFIKGAQRHGLQVKVLKRQGHYMLKGEAFLEVNQPISENIIELLKETFIFRHQEIIEDNYVYGFKQLSEVAVKALSPGINDPGTAIQVIDYMTDLFQLLIRLEGRKVLKRKDGEAGLIYTVVPFKETFYLSVTSLRTYAAQDVIVQAKLIFLIDKTSKADTNGLYAQFFKDELRSIEETASQSLKSKKDIAYLQQLLTSRQKSPKDSLFKTGQSEPE